MNRKPTSQYQPDSFEEWTYLNAMQNVVELSEDATTANGILPEGQYGFNPSNRKLFVTLFGSTYEVGTLTLT